MHLYHNGAAQVRSRSAVRLRSVSPRLSAKTLHDMFDIAVAGATSKLTIQATPAPATHPGSLPLQTGPLNRHSSARVMIQNLPQQPRQFVALIRREWSEQLVLDAGQYFVEPPQLPDPARSDRDDVAPAILRIPGALDKSPVCELVDRLHDITAVDAGAPTQRGLAGRAELLQRREQAVVVAAGIGG